MNLSKITKNVTTVHKRRYEDACATAHAMELIGDRWTLLVVRELLLGAKRFGDLRGGLPGISANVLTQRLEELEAAGLVTRQRLAPPASVHVYELTEWGYESEPIFQALGRWAARSPAHDPTLPFSAVSLVLSLRTMLDPQRAAGINAKIGLHLGDETFFAWLKKGAIRIERGALDGAELIFTAPPSILAAAIYGGQTLAAMEATGALRIDGDRALAEKFVTLFPLPPKAARPN